MNLLNWMLSEETFSLHPESYLWMWGCSADFLLLSPRLSSNSGCTPSTRILPLVRWTRRCYSYKAVTEPITYPLAGTFTQTFTVFSFPYTSSSAAIMFFALPCNKNVNCMISSWGFFLHLVAMLNE